MMRTVQRLLCIVGLSAGALATVVGCATDHTIGSAQGGSDSFDTAIDQPPNAQTLFRLARVLAAQGRDDECRYVLTEVNRRFPEFAPAYCDLAELHMRAGRADEAGDVLEQGLKHAPTDARLTGNLGMCWMVRGDYPRALEWFAKAAALGNDDTRHRANMAVALGMLGRYDEALAEYEKVVAPGPAHYNVSILARARHDADRARDELALATSLDPTLLAAAETPAAPMAR